MHADEAKDPALVAELERIMDQAVGMSLGEEHAGALDARLKTLASQQGTVWLADEEDGPTTPTANTTATGKPVERGQVRLAAALGAALGSLVLARHLFSLLSFSLLWMHSLEGLATVSIHDI
jgi:hypothetical protein